MSLKVNCSNADVFIYNLFPHDKSIVKIQYDKFIWQISILSSRIAMFITYSAAISNWFNLSKMYFIKNRIKEGNGKSSRSNQHFLCANIVEYAKYPDTARHASVVRPNGEIIENRLSRRWTKEIFHRPTNPLAKWARMQKKKLVPGMR